MLIEVKDIDEETAAELAYAIRKMGVERVIQFARLMGRSVPLADPPPVPSYVVQALREARLRKERETPKP